MTNNFQCVFFLSLQKINLVLDQHQFKIQNTVFPQEMFSKFQPDLSGTLIQQTFYCGIYSARLVVDILSPENRWSLSESFFTVTL